MPKYVGWQVDNFKRYVSEGVGTLLFLISFWVKPFGSSPLPHHQIMKLQSETPLLYNVQDGNQRHKIWDNLNLQVNKYLRK